jgi:hypothetical protein
VSPSDIEYYRALGWQEHSGNHTFQLDAMASVGFGLVERDIYDFAVRDPVDQSESHPFARDVATEVQAGWPSYAFKGVAFGGKRFADPPGHNALHDAIQLSPTCGLSLRGHDRLLPYSMLMPGFAINTIFYAAILWLPFAALGAFRRRRRIKRGLCPKCAYDLRGCESNMCPECAAIRSIPSIRG